MLQCSRRRIICSSRFCKAKQKWIVVSWELLRGMEENYFEALILKDFFDGYQLARFTQFGLVDDTKTAIADHFSVRVSHFLSSIGALTWSGHHRRNFAPIFSCKTKRMS